MLPGQFADLPTELIRTFIAVSETGSLSKAAFRLGISQPAVTAQMRRLQLMIGGPLLTKGANGTTLTPLGDLALRQARRVIDALDQLLAVSGSNSTGRPLRVGISAMLLPKFVATGFSTNKQNVSLVADHSREIKKGLVEGYIDVGCGFVSNAGFFGLDDIEVERYPVPLAWARSRSFVLSPGTPLPIIGLPDDDFMVRPLQKAGTVFRFVLQAADTHARIEAVRAGLGLCAMPIAFIPKDLVIAGEYYLPKLESIDLSICRRPGFEDKSTEIVSFMRETIFACGALGRAAAASGTNDR